MSDFRTHRDVLLVRRSMPTLARTPVLPEEHPKAPFPPNCDIHCPDLLCPLDVDSGRSSDGLSMSKPSPPPCAPLAKIKPTNAVRTNDKIGWIENMPLDEIQYCAVNPRPLRLH